VNAVPSEGAPIRARRFNLGNPDGKIITETLGRVERRMVSSARATA